MKMPKNYAHYSRTLFKLVSQKCFESLRVFVPNWKYDPSLPMVILFFSLNESIVSKIIFDTRFSFQILNYILSELILK